MTGSLPFAVEYVFSRRRTVSLEVREARVRVRAPVGTSRRLLEQLVIERANWVNDKLLQQRQRLACRPEYRFETGEHLPLLGNWLKLEVTSAAVNSVSQKDEALVVGLSARSRREPRQRVEALVTNWYRQYALELLTARTQQLCQRLGLQSRAVTVRATRSKWGHCTSDGRIQYNWQIVLAPEQALDYLVAHEVCHLRHPHHGQAFWQLVATVCPEYQRWRQWLRQEGHRLVLSS